jgi:hypothetical protein
MPYVKLVGKLYKINKSIMVLLVVFLIVVSLSLAGCTTSGTKQYTIATGGTTGTYYPIGEGIAQSVKDKNLGFNITVESTGASVANCKLLANNSVDFALVQNDVAFAAVNGTRDFSSGSINNIECVACLYPETIQVVTLESTNIKSITDLKGKKVVMGDNGSGSWFNALEILAAYGLAENDVQPQFVNISQAADMLKSGQVDAVFWTGGAPTAPISQLASTNDIYIVPINGSERTALLKKSPFYSNETLKSGTYNNLNENIETVSVMAMLVASRDVPTDDVYNLLKAIYDPNAPLKNSTAMAGMITKENGLKGMSISLHPGARKYFEEQGIGL